MEDTITFEKCIECGKHSVVERSSYKLCHSCNATFKPEWRKMIEEDLRKHLAAEFVAATLEPNGVYAVVQWKRERPMNTSSGYGVEHGTHVWSLATRSFFGGDYFEDGGEATKDYMARKQTSV